MIWDGDHFAENKWVISTCCPPSSCSVLQVNYILIKMERLKFQDSFLKWLQLLYPYQMYRRVLTDVLSTWDLNSHFSFGQPNGDKVVSWGEVFCMNILYETSIIFIFIF